MEASWPFAKRLGLVWYGAMASERSNGLSSGVASPSDSDAVDYLRKLDESLRYWYSAADTKAQVALTLNGVFLAFLTGSVLTSGDKVAKTGRCVRAGDLGVPGRNGGRSRGGHLLRDLVPDG